MQGRSTDIDHAGGVIEGQPQSTNVTPTVSSTHTRSTGMVNTRRPGKIAMTALDRPPFRSPRGEGAAIFWSATSEGTEAGWVPRLMGWYCYPTTTFSTSFHVSQ
jgi:hypothetical protein